MIQLEQVQQQSEQHPLQSRVQQLEAETDLLRLKVIPEMSYLLEQYRREIMQLHWEIDDLSRLRSHLERELEYRSTSKAAVRHLIKTALHKLNLFGFIYRRYETFVPIYNLLLGDRWKPATIVAQEQKAIAQPTESLHPLETIDMSLTQVNAMVFARSIGLEIHDEADFEKLDALGHLLETLAAPGSKILCIAPPERFYPLLCHLKERGAEVQCVACTPAEQRYLQLYRIPATSVSQDSVGSIDLLFNWMIEANCSTFADYAAIFLNADDASNLIPLFKGRISATTQIIIHH